MGYDEFCRLRRVLSIEAENSILSKFSQQQLVAVNYACGVNQSDTEKYFE